MELKLENQLKAHDITHVVFNIDKSQHQVSIYQNETLVENLKTADFLQKYKQTFQHELLANQPEPVNNHLCEIIYNDNQELFSLVNKIYTTLIKSALPEIKFKIAPSEKYIKAHRIPSVPYSIHYRMKARRSIPLDDFEKLIRRQTDTKNFCFTKGYIIDITLELKDLPEKIDDSLFISHFKEKGDFLNDYEEPFEIRFVSNYIGHGVCATRDIKKDEDVSVYCSEYGHEKSKQLAGYSFEKLDNPLNLFIDARAYGNLTRFINHAPNEDEFDINSLPEDAHDILLTANLKPEIFNYCGISFVIFRALRDIKAGETLFFDYSGKYWEDFHPTLFTKKHTFIDIKGKPFKEAKQIHHNAYRDMLDCHIKEAAIPLIIKPLLWLLLLLLFAFYINQ